MTFPAPHPSNSPTPQAGLWAWACQRKVPKKDGGEGSHLPPDFLGRGGIEEPGGLAAGRPSLSLAPLGEASWRSHLPCSVERPVSSMSPSQALPTGPPDPRHLHGCGRRPHLALQGHLCPEAHVLVPESRTHHPLAERCPGGCDLAVGSGGGLQAGTGRAGPAGLGQEAGDAWAGARGAGGWRGSSGEVLSAVLINYLPASGLVAALSCLLANTLSHVWSSGWTGVWSPRPPQTMVYLHLPP